MEAQLSSTCSAEQLGRYRFTASPAGDQEKASEKAKEAGDSSSGWFSQAGDKAQVCGKVDAVRSFKIGFAP